MYSKFYQQELFHLRELAKEFAEVHPAIAPMVWGQSTDPDVERLLEGTAFLTGLLRQKLDDHLPEVIHALTNFTFPHFLQTVPSMTIMRFTPHRGLQETLTVSKGTEIASSEVDGVSSLFRTCFDCDVHPLELKSVQRRTVGNNDELLLDLTILGPSIDIWLSDRLSFFLGGSYSRASEVFFLLTRCLKNIILESQDGSKRFTLPPSALHPIAFDREKSLFPMPSNSFTGFRHLQEYFLFPHKFLFVELSGINQWKERGDSSSFRIIFQFDSSRVKVPQVTNDTFLLSTVPAINLFSHESDPIILDHTLEKIRVTPSLVNGVRPQIFSVDSVTGYSRGAVTRKEYTPVTCFRGEDRSNTYNLLHSISPVYNKPDLQLQFAYPEDSTLLADETLTIQLTCTNGDIPTHLKPGDISKPTSSTPELIGFNNLMQPTMPIDPPLDGDSLWRLLSHLSLNLLSLASADSLTELLTLYSYDYGRDRGRVSANEKRIMGLEELTVSNVNRLNRGYMMQGQSIKVVARSDHFASIGDFSLFGMVLDTFFSEYCSINSFIQLELQDSVSGEKYSWPARLGKVSLI